MLIHLRAVPESDARRRGHLRPNVDVLAPAGNLKTSNRNTFNLNIDLAIFNLDTLNLNLNPFNFISFNFSAFNLMPLI